MKDPAFNFYSDNFLSGTMFFTDEQVGKYMRLLCAQHQTGHLEEKHMIFICKGHDEDIWKKFKKDDNGLYYNERLEFEINKRKAYSLSRSENKKGKVKSSKSDKKIIKKSYDKHMGNGIGIGKEIEIKINKVKELCKNVNYELIINEFEKWKDYLSKQHSVFLLDNEYTLDVLIDAIERVGDNNLVKSIDFSIKSNYKKIYNQEIKVDKPLYHLNQAAKKDSDFD